jgi:hypothetical protein
MAMEARHGSTMTADPVAAAAELATQIGRDGLDCVLFFCSPTYDLDLLGRTLAQTFHCPLIGCTSSGQLGPGGFQKGGLSGVSLSGGVRVEPYLVRPLSQSQAQAARIGDAVHLTFETSAAAGQLFGLLLVDGLSLMEERLTAALYQALGNVPIIGGSAGDDLRFETTFIYFDGRFYADAAVFTVFETHSPFATFKLQHFVPTPTRLVITDALPEQRIIREINGEPAAVAYAEAVGLPIEKLDATVFSQNPLLVRIGDDYYGRSIYKLNPDLSFTCLCAIDTGIVVSIGRGVDALATLEQAFDAVREIVPEPALVIGCDCILRRLELEQAGSDQRIGEFLSANRVIGFSTYGEQFNGVHVNQTFTGVAIGA